MTALDERLRAFLPPAVGSWDGPPGRRAAVLAPIVAAANGDELLLLVRPTTLRLHPGQIGFPGGRDAGDADPATCALREASEEIGVDAARVLLLGSLPPRSSSSGLRVHCVVGRIEPTPLRLQASEVDRIVRVPIAALADLDRWHQLPHPATAERPGTPPAGAALPTSPHFLWAKDRIWGLTGRFARDLAQAIHDAPPA